MKKNEIDNAMAVQAHVHIYKDNHPIFQTRATQAPCPAIAVLAQNQHGFQRFGSTLPTVIQQAAQGRIGKSRMNSRSSFIGNTTSEYALLIGLISLAAVGGLSLLGNSSHHLFENTGNNLKTGSANNLVNFNFSGGQSSGTQGGGGDNSSPFSERQLAVQGNPTSFANPVNLGITEGNSSGTNATAAEGATNKIEAAYQNTSYALQMEEKLSPSMDPNLYEWANKITRLSKQAAGAEGVLNDLNAFKPGKDNTALGPGQKPNPDSLTNSLINYQGQLQDLLQNPPKGVNPSDVNFYTQLGSGVANNLNQETNGKTIKNNIQNKGNTLALTDFTQYMNDEQLNNAIHQTAESGEAKKVSTGLDTVMQNSDTLNQRGHR